ncbi:MAG: hypothetical protein AAF985_18505, partial [Bacteroidota bacterium]
MSKPTDPDSTLAPSPQSLPDWPHLVQKVKASAYWNILQKSVTHLDLVQLDQEGQPFADQLMQQLFDKGKIQAEIKSTVQSSERLQHLYQASINGKIRKGSNELGLGFPF